MSLKEELVNACNDSPPSDSEALSTTKRIQTYNKMNPCLVSEYTLCVSCFHRIVFQTIVLYIARRHPHRNGSRRARIGSPPPWAGRMHHARLHLGICIISLARWAVRCDPTREEIHTKLWLKRRLARSVMRQSRD